jgi:O-antigen ligase
MAINLVGLQRKWLLALTGLLLSGTLLLSPVVQQRMHLLISEARIQISERNPSPTTSIGVRLALWQGALQTFRDYPILGAGIDGYQIVMQRIFPQWEVSGRVKNPHNSYLYIAASYGLVGIALHLWLLGAVIRRAWPCRSRWQGFFCLTTVMVIAVGSLTEATLSQPQTGTLLAMMIGLPDEG